MERAELTAWLRLTLSPGVGNDTARKLLAAFGSAEAVFVQSAAALRQLGGDKLVSAITLEPPKLAGLLQATVDWLAAGDNRTVAPIGSSLSSKPSKCLHRSINLLSLSKQCPAFSHLADEKDVYVDSSAS